PEERAARRGELVLELHAQRPVAFHRSVGDVGGVHGVARRAGVERAQHEIAGGAAQDSRNLGHGCAPSVAARTIAAPKPRSTVARGCCTSAPPRSSLSPPLPPPSDLPRSPTSRRSTIASNSFASRAGSPESAAGSAGPWSGSMDIGLMFIEFPLYLMTKSANRSTGRLLLCQ